MEGLFLEWRATDGSPKRPWKREPDSKIHDHSGYHLEAHLKKKVYKPIQLWTMGGLKAILPGKG